MGALVHFILVAVTLAPRAAAATDTIVSFNAGSLAGPLRAVLDSFALRTGAVVQQENAGSLETARKLVDLGRMPDVIALADEGVFRELLMPRYTPWYVRFARNRMTIAYTPASRYASAITSENWYDILRRPGVEIGRADPNLDPNGYQTLIALQLAEQFYRSPGLATALTSQTSNMRPKETDLLALLQTGELDYVWSYESLAQAAALPYVPLPPEVNLGEPADSARYASVTVYVRGRKLGTTIPVMGRPIIYGIAIPVAAPHREAAIRFLTFLLSSTGQRILRRAHLDAFDRPMVTGTAAPPAIVRPQTP
jgi:molybdate/tungstate transport system substrate-binding protein